MEFVTVNKARNKKKVGTVHSINYMVLDIC